MELFLTARPPTSPPDKWVDWWIRCGWFWWNRLLKLSIIIISIIPLLADLWKDIISKKVLFRDTLFKRLEPTLVIIIVGHYGYTTITRGICLKGLLLKQSEEEEEEEEEGEWEEDGKEGTCSSYVETMFSLRRWIDSSDEDGDMVERRWDDTKIHLS